MRAHCRAIAGAGIVCLDANLEPAALAEAVALAKAAGVPVWFEPVSRTKALAGMALLGSLTFASPNEEEALEMACAADARRGPALRRLADVATARSSPVPLDILARAAEILVLRGLKCAVITLGPRGVLWAHRAGSAREVEVRRLVALPVPATEVASVSGAGDALVAGTLLRLQAGDGVAEALAFGQAAARQVVESPRNVPEAFDTARLTAGARAALASQALIRPVPLPPAPLSASPSSDKAPP